MKSEESKRAIRILGIYPKLMGAMQAISLDLEVSEDKHPHKARELKRVICELDIINNTLEATRHKEILALRYIRGHTVYKVAEVCHMSERNVRRLTVVALKDFDFMTKGIDFSFELDKLIPTEQR